MQYIISVKKDLYQNLLPNQIVFLKEIEKTIQLDKFGKFYYWSMKGDYYDLSIREITNFLSVLETDEIYTVIPLLSKNNTPSEPYIILSQQILCSFSCDSIIIKNFLLEQIKKTFELYEINNLNDFSITLKFKLIKFIIP